jgi:hypothetical protein
MAHLVMFVIFYVNVIFLIKISIYRIFAEFFHFWDQKFQISHMVSKHGSYYMKWRGSLYLQLS